MSASLKSSQQFIPIGFQHHSEHAYISNNGFRSTIAPSDSSSDNSLEDSNDLEYVNLSVFDDLESISDGQVAEILNSKGGIELLNTMAHSNYDPESSEVINDEKAIPMVRSPFAKSIMEIIPSICSFRVVFETVELYKKSKFDSIWIEYTFPGYNGDEPQGRFKTKAIQKIEKENTSNIKVKHSVTIPIFFEANSNSQWGESSVEFKIIFIKSSSGTKLSKLLIENEGQVLYGRMRLNDIFVAPKMHWDGDIALYSNKKSKNCDIEGSLILSIDALFESDGGKPIDGVQNTEEDSMWISISSPSYLYFHLGRVRALSITESPLVKACTLLYLKIRLFSSSNMIETPPITYINPFNANTGIISDTSDFNYGHTTPLALTKEFLEKSGKAPIIVEVYTLQPSLNNERLLGLIRLPFNQLIEAMISNFRNSSRGITDNLQIPDTEYVIKDPFTGESKGWVHGFMSIGSWEQVEILRRNFQHDSIPELVAKLVSPKKLPRLVRSKSPLRAESVIQVTIHGVCGLLGLLSQYSNHCDIDLLPALDYAKDLGTNTLIKLILFPHEGVGDEQETIVTPMIAASFVPRFENTIEITIQGLDTDLIIWMKNGGCAEGQVWHRIPNHLSHSLVGQSCLLGTFQIPLASILTRKHGITKEWFSILDSPNGIKSRAAVEVSLAFKHGHELGQIQNHLYGSCVYEKLNLNIRIENLKMQMNESSGENQVYVKWQPIPGESDWEYSDSKTLLYNETTGFLNASELYNGTMELEISSSLLESMNEHSLEFQVWFENDNQSNYYIGSAFVSISELFTGSKIFQRSRSSSLRRPSLEGTFQLINPESADLGSSFVDIKLQMELMRPPNVFKKSIRSLKKKESSSKFEQPGDLPLHIDQLELPLHIDQLESTSPKAKAETHKGIVSMPIVDSIFIYISVEKAMNLPLVEDPLATSMTSPFVRPDIIRTSPPNTFVTFGSGILKKDLTTRYFQSRVIPSETRPSWDFKESLQISRSHEDLTEIKMSYGLVFSVWHATDPLIKKWGDGEIMEPTRIPSDMRILLGTVTVSFAPLFAGLYEIHGWYPILGNDGSTQGQLMVQIRPAEHLGFTCRRLSELNGHNDEHNELHNIGPMEPPQTLSDFLKAPIKEPDDGAFKGSLDTWIWKGAKTNQASPVCQDNLFTVFLPNRSISETMHELDLLNTRMMERLGKKTQSDIDESLIIKMAAGKAGESQIGSSHRFQIKEPDTKAETNSVLENDSVISETFKPEKVKNNLI